MGQHLGFSLLLTVMSFWYRLNYNVIIIFPHLGGCVVRLDFLNVAILLHLCDLFSNEIYFKMFFAQRFIILSASAVIQFQFVWKILTNFKLLLNFSRIKKK